MYFKQIDEIVSGAKTQTRRVCKEDEWMNIPLAGLQPPTVYTSAGRIKWQVGRDYAVCPTRGKPGVWWNGVDKWTFDTQWDQSDWRPLRIRITAIRRESLQNITEADAIAEGIRPGDFYGLMSDRDVYDFIGEYRDLWESINGCCSWETNPDVWVLTFEVVK